MHPLPLSTLEIFKKCQLVDVEDSYSEGELPIRAFSFHDFMPPSELPDLQFSDYAGSYTYLGIDDPDLDHRAADFCQNTARIVGEVQPVLAAFLQHARSTHLQPHHTSLWLSVRVTQPDNMFDSPNWHLDGRHFEPQSDHPVFKIGAAISGPPTLFLQNTEQCVFPRWSTEQHSTLEHLCQVANMFSHTNPWLPERINYWVEEDTEFQRGTPQFALYREKVERCYWKSRRANLADSLRFIECRSPLRGQVAKWVVGDGVGGSVHSEPALTRPRLFISLLPGTEEEIRQLCKHWGQEFGSGVCERYDGELRAHLEKMSSHSL